MKYLFIILIILFNGCIGTKDKNINIPAWYINTPKNNNTFIYGSSNAYDLNEAKINALNDMASRLVVTVSSTINKHTTNSTIDLQKSYSKDVSQDINLEVEKIKFTNAIIEKNQLINNQFFLVMKVNRQQLFQQNLKDFTIIDEKIKNKLNSLSTLTTLIQIYQLQNLYPTLIKAKKQAYVLYAINNSFNHNKYISEYDDAINTISKLKNTITINVQEDNNNLFKEEMINLLNKASYKTINAQANTNIKLKSIIIHSIYKGWNIAKATITISIKTDNKNISNKTLNIIGRSSSNEQNALANARLNFKRKINEIGLDYILFN